MSFKQSKDLPGLHAFWLLAVPAVCLFGSVFGRTQKRASDPRPPHTRQTYEQEAGQNMTPHASKQGKLESAAAIFLCMFLPCTWGLGFLNDSPILKGFFFVCACVFFLVPRHEIAAIAFRKAITNAGRNHIPPPLPLFSGHKALLVRSHPGKPNACS